MSRKIHNRDAVLNVTDSSYDCQSIRASAICSGCNQAELDTLHRHRIITRHPAKSMICHCGDRQSFVATVGQGALAMGRSLKDGRQSIVGVLLPGDFFGYPCTGRHQFDIQALTNVTLCRFQRQEFERLIATCPNLCQRVLDVTGHQLADARIWIHIIGCKTAREKVASLIVLLVMRSRHRDMIEVSESGTEIWLPFSRSSIADLLGLSVETVSRTFGELRKAGVISYQGPRQVTIPSIERLVSETGELVDHDELQVNA